MTRVVTCQAVGANRGKGRAPRQPLVYPACPDVGREERRATALLPFHSRQIYRCNAQRASVVESENSMARTMDRATTRATMRAAAYDNPNQPGTHLPRKIALPRPSFLIQRPELETELTCTKQTADPISNRQFFAFLNLPDTASACRAGGVRKPPPFANGAQDGAPGRERQSGAEPPHSKKKNPTLTNRAWGTRQREEKRRRAAALQKEKPHAHKSSMGHPENQPLGRGGTRGCRL